MYVSAQAVLVRATPRKGHWTPAVIIGKAAVERQTCVGVGLILPNTLSTTQNNLLSQPVVLRETQLTTVGSLRLMVDPRTTRDRDAVTREQVQALWNDSRHWALGIIYHCREDPRVIVRNRFVVGWTWNFGHPMVFPTMGAFTLFALAPGAVLLTLGILQVPLLIGVTVAAVALLVMIARRIESGP